MKNRILFLCPDNKNATGGVKQIYRQVDILNKNGYNAHVLHKKIGYKSKFFKNNTSIRYNSKIFNRLNYTLKINDSQKKLKVIKWETKMIFYNIISFFKSPFELSFEEDDILVFPEIYGLAINKIEPKLKKIIFNQNCYYSFQTNSIFDDKNRIPYFDKNLLLTIVASEDALNYFKFAIPDLTIRKLRLGIDETIFNYSNQKKKQIAFMPRKLEEDLVQVINILKLRNNLNDWSFVSIDNKSENEVATILKESMIFLSFNHREGFGLPPAEAMACGCIVVGYAGNGGDEYFNANLNYKVNDRNVVAFVQKIEYVISEFKKDPNLMIEKGLQASNFILNEYNFKNEEADIVSIWTNLSNRM